MFSSFTVCFIQYFNNINKVHRFFFITIITAISTNKRFSTSRDNSCTLQGALQNVSYFSSIYLEIKTISRQYYLYCIKDATFHFVYCRLG